MSGLDAREYAAVVRAMEQQRLEFEKRERQYQSEIARLERQIEQQRADFRKELREVTDRFGHEFRRVGHANFNLGFRRAEREYGQQQQHMSSQHSHQQRRDSHPSDSGYRGYLRSQY
jgi:multidrug resistance efflux pump